MEECKPAPTLAIKNQKDGDEDLQLLEPEDAEKHRRSVGILL